MTLFEQIKVLEERSERELEISSLKKSKWGKIPKEFMQEFRKLEDERINKSKFLMKEGWEKLQSLGYKKYDYRGNAAYESGHSDNPNDSNGDYHFWGVVAPDGTKFPGNFSWTEGILPAIQHAGI